MSKPLPEVGSVFRIIDKQTYGYRAASGPHKDCIGSVMVPIGSIIRCVKILRANGHEIDREYQIDDSHAFCWALPPDTGWAAVSPLEQLALEAK